ncbi:MAG: AMP-binding protein, partial [Paracoccaceae bacterium]
MLGGITVNKSEEDAKRLVSIPALLRRNAANFGSLTAFREKEFGIWQTWSWSKALAEAESVALGFIELGIQPGEFVAVIGRNRPDLYISMIAIQMAGGTPVPLYQDAVAEEMEYVLAHCGAKFVIAGDQEQVDKVLEIQSKLPNFEQMIYLDGRGLRKYD